ncbi:MAG: tetratricopeptide repeat protein, partial [Planctomycetota bacterium]
SQYITETYGFEKIVEMLSAYQQGRNTEQVFHEVLGISLEEFDGKFFAYARKLAGSFGIYPRYLPDQIQALRYAAQDHPKEVDRWVKLGLAYLYAGRDTDAELSIGRALKLGPKDGDLNALIGFLKFKQKKTRAAIEAFDTAIASGTHYRYRCRVALGILLTERDERERAIVLFREAIDIHPDGVRPRFGKPNPYLLLAGLLHEEKRDDEAVAVLEKLVRVSRDDVEVRKRLGAVYRVQEKWEKLVQALDDAVYIDPYDMEVHRFLAEGYLQLEAYSLALRELTVQLADEKAEKNALFGEISWCHYHLGDPEKALEFADKALERAPKNPRALEVKKLLVKKVRSF